MKIIRYVLLSFFLVFLSCDDLVLLEDYPLVEEVASFTENSVETVSLDVINLIVEAKVNQLGDGIKQHGTIWSTNTNEVPNIELNTKTELGAQENVGQFEDILNQDLFEFNVSYNLVSYAVDVHDKVIYGDPIVFQRGLTFEKEVLPFGTQDELVSILPIVALSNGQIALGGSRYSDPTDNNLYKLNADGTIDASFNEINNSVLENWTHTLAPIDILETTEDLIIIGEDMTNGQKPDIFDKSTGNYKGTYVELPIIQNASWQTSLKLFDSPLPDFEVFVLSDAQVGTSSQMLLKSFATVADPIKILDLEENQLSERAYDAINIDNERVLILGKNFDGDREPILAVVELPNNLPNPERYSSGLNSYVPLRINKTPQGDSEYLVVGSSSEGTYGLFAIGVNADFEFNNSHFANDDIDLSLNDALILENGDFIVCGDRNNKAYIAKYIQNGSNYDLAWEKDDFNSTTFTKVTASIDGGILIAGINFNKQYILKLDKNGNIYD